jgi:hypothetical protein
LAGHGGDVAEVNGHGLATYAARPRLGQSKATAFQQHVSRYQARYIRPEADRRAVVAGAEQDARIGTRAAAKPIDEGKLTGHGVLAPERLINRCEFINV